MLRSSSEVTVLILSREINPVTTARAKKLKIESITGLTSKIESLHSFAAQQDVSLSHTCYIGNDLNDIECMQAIGVSVAVADAYVQVRKIADYVTRRTGGNGAVREVCELILYAQGSHPHP
jgi:YrbI family 3-deoxy-D-manno-octulosonate 8-phosphate phosphatase